MGYCNTLLIFTGLGLWLWEKVLAQLEISKDIYFYLAIFPIYNSYIYYLNTGYHYEITILFFFFLVLYGIFQKNSILELLGLGFLLMIKEDMPFYVILFATTFLFQKKNKKFFKDKKLIKLISIKNKVWKKNQVKMLKQIINKITKIS
jgi:hypothetical protein